MKRINRRRALALIAGAPALIASRARLMGVVAESSQETVPGAFQGTSESLREWRVPDWYRDAKFGIWVHCLNHA